MRVSKISTLALGLIAAAAVTIHTSAFAEKGLSQMDPILEGMSGESGMYSSDAGLPVLLTAGIYTCKDAYGNVIESKLVVDAGGETFTFGNPPQNYTESAAVNGGNSGQIGFKGSGGAEVIVTTGTGGLPPYTLTFRTADGAKFKYTCQ